MLSTQSARPFAASAPASRPGPLRGRSAGLLVSVLAALAAAGCSGGEPAPDGGASSAASGATSSAERPRLVVLLAVDQLIPEQLERLGPDFTGGFARLLAEGAVVEGAELPYARTETGAGHVTFGTGCLPRTHGVVGNSFWDRLAEKERYCVDDPDAFEVSVAGIDQGRGQRSPSTILAPTLAEHVQRALPGARAASISAKDRAAIGMFGAAKGPAVWWDKSSGTGFVSSNCYGDALSGFVSQWNATWLERGRAYLWEDTSPVGDDPAATYARWGTAADEREGERPMGESGVTFPYAVPEGLSDKNLGGYLYGTPATDEYVTEVALLALDELELGRDHVTDVLCVSYSACDVVGHTNGPYSREVTDLLFRLDRHLGRLFDELDAKVGEGRWVAALTSDHGVLPLPEWLEARGEKARRVTGDEIGAMRGELAKRLQARLGEPVVLRSAPAGYHIDLKRLAKTGIEPREARLAAAEILRELAAEIEWLDTAYAYDEIAEFSPEGTDARALLARSFHPDRTADVVMVTAPNVLLGWANGTSHGTHYDYDRRIPLIFLGPGLERVRVPEGYIPGSQDAVPTLLARLRLAREAKFDGVSLLAPR